MKILPALYLLISDIWCVCSPSAEKKCVNLAAVLWHVFSMQWANYTPWLADANLKAGGGWERKYVSAHEEFWNLILPL